MIKFRRNKQLKRQLLSNFNDYEIEQKISNNNKSQR